MSYDFIAHFALYSEILTKIIFFGEVFLNANFKEIEQKANKKRPILLWGKSWCFL